MLSPDYLLRISEGAEEIAEELHTDILNRIIERIMIRIGRGDSYLITAQDKWQLQVLTDAGYLLEDIQTEIVQRVGLMQTEIAEAMEDAGVKAVEYDNAVYQAAGLSPTPLDQSPSLIRIMQRNYEATLGEWTNFTGTIAGAAQQSFIRACDRAYQLAMSGTLSYSQAVKEALDVLVADGVTVTYPSGHTDTIETATLRAVRTGISQASGQITDARMEEMDWDIILVSSHMGARPGDGAEDFKNHAWWQGKFYSKSGKDKRFLPWLVCGMGHVQGIHGANCRHSHGPGDGENNPYEQYDTEENKKAYELQQRQRTLERRIRDTKRQTMNWKTARDNATDEAVKADLDFQYQRKAALLQKQNKAYNDFCEETGLKKRSDRISIAKWDRKQAAAARGAASRRVSSVGEQAATSNWHTIPVAGGQTETKYRRTGASKSIDQNVALTNPGYKNGGPAYRQNCQRCVAAYEMRRRGYDVIAKGALVGDDGKLSTKDPLYSKWHTVFKDAKFTFCYGTDGGLNEALSQMKSWGDSAVAEVHVRWKNGGAHVFVAQREGEKIRFVDPQNGNTDCIGYFTKAVNGATMIARIDGLEPTDLIEKCIKNRGGKQ